MGDDANELGPLDDYLSLFKGNDNGSDETTDVAETTHDNEAESDGCQLVGHVRHYRQRFGGLEEEYVYRNAILIRGSDGKKRRVRVGETVDVENSGLNLRRLRSLWYAERIELKNGVGSPAKPKGQITITDNRAIREKDLRKKEREEQDTLNRRSGLQRQRQRDREERELREAAKKAVETAELREEQELLDMEAEELRAEEKERSHEALLELQEREREEAEEAIEAARVQAIEDAEAKAQAAEEAAAADAKSKAEYAQHLEGKRARMRARQEAERANQRSPEERAQIIADRGVSKTQVNPDNVKLSAKDAKDKLKVRAKAEKAAKLARPPEIEETTD